MGESTLFIEFMLGCLLDAMRITKKRKKRRTKQTWGYFDFRTEASMGFTDFQ